jgi:hypothetical protein
MMDAYTKRLTTGDDEFLFGHHPGFSASNCEHRIVVSGPGLQSRRGFACGWTGGHCIPGSAMPCKENPA